MLCSTSCYTYSTSLDRGWGENHPHHEGVSYPMRPVQWQTDGQDKHMTTLQHNILTDKLRSTVLKKVAAQQRRGFTANMNLNAWWRQNAVFGTYALHSPLTLHLATAWTASSWNLDYSSISWYLEIQWEHFFFYWCSVMASDEPLWSVNYRILTWPFDPTSSRPKLLWQWAVSPSVCWCHSQPLLSRCWALYRCLYICLWHISCPVYVE